MLPHGGLLVLPAGTPIAYRDLIIALSVRYRLPVVDPFRPFVLDGGLMAYATDQIEMVRMAASYVDRILRGAYPTDLPVQTPLRRLRWRSSALGSRRIADQNLQFNAINPQAYLTDVITEIVNGHAQVFHDV